MLRLELHNRSSGHRLRASVASGHRAGDPAPGLHQHGQLASGGREVLSHVDVRRIVEPNEYTLLPMPVGAWGLLQAEPRARISLPVELGHQARATGMDGAWPATATLAGVLR